MRSKTRRKVLFIVFSALIMVGLLIGAFADYADDRVGTVLTVEPFDIGEKLVDYDTTSTYHFNEGYYILYLNCHNFDFDATSSLIVYNVNNSNYNFIGYYLPDNYYFVRYDGYHVTSEFEYKITEAGEYYIYCSLQECNIVRSDSYDSNHLSISVYSIDNTYDIDIYDNSQDAWASVVSVVTDATDSIINNDLLLLFAAAVPVISFGVGFLIRLKYRG